MLVRWMLLELQLNMSLTAKEAAKEARVEAKYLGLGVSWSKSSGLQTGSTAPTGGNALVTNATNCVARHY
jgi:hypothetical protein